MKRIGYAYFKKWASPSPPAPVRRSGFGNSEGGRVGTTNIPEPGTLFRN